MAKTKVDWRIVVSAILGITIIEVIALLKGINGTLLTIVVGIIAGIGGYVTPNNIITK